mgnify:CR=1 FL=1
MLKLFTEDLALTAEICLFLGGIDMDGKRIFTGDILFEFDCFNLIEIFVQDLDIVLFQIAIEKSLRLSTFFSLKMVKPKVPLLSF